MQNTILAFFRAFTPRMAGSNACERALACLGAMIGICLTGLITGWVVGTAQHLPLMVAPLGASAVLLFAVPSSPLAQPWSIIGGNTLSALTGIAVAHLVPDMAIAAGLAVAAAIAVMSMLRCLHPPGGAASLLGVLGGTGAASWSFSFAFMPVALNSVLLVILGIIFHRLSSRAYPHRPGLAATRMHGTSNQPPRFRTGPTEADIDAALAGSGETYDIAREDLHRLIRQAEISALERSSHLPRCHDIMSRHVLRVQADAAWSEAQALIRSHDLRVLPVVDPEDRVAGILETRESGDAPQTVSAMMREAATALPDDSLSSLIGPLTGGRHHAVLVTDGGGRLVGLVTQTDMIVALARLAVSGAAKG